MWKRKIKKEIALIVMLFLGILLNLMIFLPQESKAAIKENPKLTKKVTICIGRSKRLKVTGTTKQVTWKTSDKKVVKVSRKGNIRGIKKGKATITAKVGKKELTCKVNVVEALPIKETKLTLENVGWKSISYYSNDIYCKSSNKKVATVAVIPSADGTETPYEKSADIVIFGHKSGTAMITITNDCNKEKVKFKVTVKKPETESNYQKIIDYVLLNGMVEEDTGDKVISRKCDKNNAIASIWLDTMSEQIKYEYEEKNDFGKVKWLLMPTEKENAEAYMVLWLYPAGSTEEYYVTSVIDVETYAGEKLVFEEGWYRTPALENLQGIANEVSQRAIACIDKIVWAGAGATWRDGH